MTKKTAVSVSVSVRAFFRVHLHEHFARFAAGDGLSVFENLFIEEERVRQEDHLVGDTAAAS